ncbi:nematocyst expressed protein 4-like [Eupeodes corollae]|uniref:nematocyst expressed protein 4-like n=1 Tax=Eupeodes corollae TaxID=290404 RepID=UPI0024927F59|nr:nematocyst expressed protein 4-like [Eupeodes corollae]
MQYLLLIVLLYGLSGNYWQVFGFGFGPFAPSPFCPSPYYVVAPSYSVYPAYPPPPLGFFDAILQTIFAKKGKSYPPPFGYPPPPPPLYYPPPPPPPVYYPPPPPPPPAQLPSIQDQIIKVHITKDYGDEEGDHHHHHHHHDHGHNSDYNNWD